MVGGKQEWGGSKRPARAVLSVRGQGLRGCQREEVGSGGGVKERTDEGEVLLAWSPEWRGWGGVRQGRAYFLDEDLLNSSQLHKHFYCP